MLVIASCSRAISVVPGSADSGLESVGRLRGTDFPGGDRLRLLGESGGRSRNEAKGEDRHDRHDAYQQQKSLRLPRVMAGAGDYDPPGIGDADSREGDKLCVFEYRFQTRANVRRIGVDILSRRAVGKGLRRG